MQNADFLYRVSGWLLLALLCEQVLPAQQPGNPAQQTRNPAQQSNANAPRPPVRTSQAPVNDFSFAILADRTGSAQPGVYERVFQEVLAFSPDFAITIGDAIEGRNDQTAAAEWQAMRQLWATAPFPLHHTAGNHDIWNAASLPLYQQATGREPTYTFRFGRAQFFILDNSRTDEISDPQLDYLEQQLRQAGPASPKFVFFHRPYWLVPIAMKRADFRLHQLAKKYGVHTVFSGHGHQLVRLTHEGVNYVEVGSSGGTIARNLANNKGFADGFFFGWLWVRVRGDQVTVTGRELGPPFGQGRIYRLEDWEMNGPRFAIDDPLGHRAGPQLPSAVSTPSNQPANQPSSAPAQPVQ